MKLGIENILINPIERLSSLPVARSRTGGEIRKLSVAKSRNSSIGGMRHAAVVCDCRCLITLLEDPVITGGFGNPPEADKNRQSLNWINTP